MMIELPMEPVRDVTGSQVFADITSVPYIGYHPGTNEAPPYLEFGAPLDQLAVDKIVYRCTHTEAEEQAFNVLNNIQAQIDALQKGSGPMTINQLTEAVKILANGVNQLWTLRQGDPRAL